MKHLKRINESQEFEEDLKSYLAWLTDAGFRIDFQNEEQSYHIRIWKPVDISKQDRYGYSNSRNFLWSEISDELNRAFITISQDFEFDIDYIYTIESSFTSSGYDRKFHTEEEFMNGLRLQSIKSFFISLKL
jgi:hypothetical protein